jgi:hypothetical protein
MHTPNPSNEPLAFVRYESKSYDKPVAELPLF